MKKKNELKEMRTISESSRTILNATTFESRGSRRRRQKKDHEKILEEIIVENFPKMGKEELPKCKKPRESQTG